MFGLLSFHEIAARRGDGLRPEFFGLLRQQPLRERLTIIPGGLAEPSQLNPSDAGGHSLGETAIGFQAQKASRTNQR